MKLEDKDIVWLHRLLSESLEDFGDGCGCCVDKFLNELHDGDDDFKKRREDILLKLTIDPGAADGI